MRHPFELDAGKGRERDPVQDANAGWGTRLQPTIKGTRISVELVIELLGRGYSKEQILEQYEGLTAEDIQACLAYASEILKSERVYALPD